MGSIQRNKTKRGNQLHRSPGVMTSHTLSYLISKLMSLSWQTLFTERNYYYSAPFFLSREISRLPLISKTIANNTYFMWSLTILLISISQKNLKLILRFFTLLLTPFCHVSMTEAEFSGISASGLSCRYLPGMYARSPFSLWLSSTTGNHYPLLSEYLLENHLIKRTLASLKS